MTASLSTLASQHGGVNPNSPAVSFSREPYQEPEVNYAYLDDLSSLQLLSQLESDVEMLGTTYEPEWAEAKELIRMLKERVSGGRF